MSGSTSMKTPAEDNSGQCRACHGTDYRGTVLSRALGDRMIDTKWGTKNFWQGFQIGCYTCHDGPDDDDRYRQPRTGRQSRHGFDGREHRNRDRSVRQGRRRRHPIAPNCVPAGKRHRRSFGLHRHVLPVPRIQRQRYHSRTPRGTARPTPTWAPARSSSTNKSRSSAAHPGAVSPEGGKGMRNEEFGYSDFGFRI